MEDGMTNERDPYLYILVRNDLDSMNCGKMVAQGCHAANQMVFEFSKFKSSLNDSEQKLWSDLFESWELSANGFGVTISLGVNEREMRTAIMVAKALGLHAGITHDPSYPLIDGQVCHLLPLDTCAYIFADKKDCYPVIGRFSLLP